MKSKTAWLIRVTGFAFLLGIALPAHAFYNPNAGRWLSRDPIAEDGGKNLYGIVSNDAVNANDYLGMAAAPKTPTELYCEAAEKYPENKWLQCVCRVSGQVNQLMRGLLAAGIQASAQRDSDRAQTLKAKAEWFHCMNRCMSKRWQVAQKHWEGGTLSDEEKKQLNPEWEKYCTDCRGRAKAASRKCCEQQVRGEQQGFDECTKQCGKYQATWGAPAGALTGQVMPGWDPAADFNDYDKRVEFGIKLCCGKK